MDGPPFLNQLTESVEMCDLIHTWEKVRRRGGFLKFRYARSPVSRPIGRRLFAHALRDLSAASTTESLSRSGAMASRCAVVSPSRNVCAKPGRFPPIRSLSTTNA